MDASALVPLIFFVLIFIVLIVLPQRARARMQQRQRDMQQALTIGVEVMMTCGLHGRVAALADDSLDLEVSPGVVMRFERAAIASVREETQDVFPPDQGGGSGAEAS